MNKPMHQELLEWFAKNKRDLPWRENRTPYRVWISEIMLQQTRVETVIPYYTRWMEAFPNPVSLAKSDEQQVLKQWEGLGYYSRARTLYKTAGIIMQKWNGIFPNDLKTLESLPGIGRYTAGAIASIAFNQAVPALDGNIRRIYSRLFDLAIPLRTKESETILWQLAGSEIEGENSPGAYHEALMDLGSSVCLPSAPRCLLCPLTSWCEAFKKNRVSQRPVTKQAKSIPHFIVTAGIIQKPNDEVLIAQRPAHGLLGGLWEFPGGKQEKNETLEECLIRELREELEVQVIIKAPFGVYKHAYTHFRVTLHAFLCEIGDQNPQPVEAQALRWVEIPNLAAFPMGKIDRQIARDLQKLEPIRNGEESIDNL